MSVLTRRANVHILALRQFCGPWTVHKTPKLRVQLISERGYSMLRVASSTCSRVAGLSSPSTWTTIVQVALFEILMLVVLQEKSGVSYKRPLF